jgi:DNA polymerase
MSSKRAMAQLLRHLAGTGVTHLPKVDVPKPSRVLGKPRPSLVVAETAAASESISATAETVVPRTPSRLKASTPVAEMKRPSSVLEPDHSAKASLQAGPFPETKTVMETAYTDLGSRRDALSVLAKCVAGCQRCPELASRRTQTVFGVGNPTADIMFIGEAPGAEEDAKGEPFVGPAGQLLNKIIEASQLKREDLYICNILRCRPPGNRNPLPEEAVNCREFLDAQIHVVQPKYIVCWGTVAAQNLLNETQAVGKLRGKLFDYRGIKVMCTYHPSYLLRNPAAKKQVWEDMKFFMKHLGVELQ